MELAGFKKTEYTLNPNGDYTKTILDNWESWVRSMPGKSATTKTTYLRNGAKFILFIQGNNGINSNSMEDYRNELESIEIAVRTKNAYLAAAKAICRLAYKKGVIPVNITSDVPAFKIAGGHAKEGLTVDEATRILRYIEGIRDPFKKKRFLAIFYLLAGCGLRQSELQQLKTTDIDFINCTMRIKRKGRDSLENIPMLRFVANIVQDYVKEIPEGYLFESTTKPGNPVSLRYLRNIMTHRTTGLFSKCRIKGKSTHSFRHFAITSWLDASGGNVRLAQQLAGHTSISTTMIYDDKRLTRKDLNSIESDLYMIWKKR